MARVPVAAVSVMVPLPFPEAGESVNQAALSLADQVSVPPPVLLMLSACVAGLLPPCVAVKERLVGLAPMAGTAGGELGGGDDGGSETAAAADGATI